MLEDLIIFFQLAVLGLASAVLLSVILYLVGRHIANRGRARGAFEPESSTGLKDARD